MPPAVLSPVSTRLAQAGQPLRPPARWVAISEPATADVARLVEALLLPEPVCRLLVSRGHADPELAKRFLRPRLEHLAEPESMYDLPRAVSRIADAVRAQETILVHGDYDVDGMSSTALMVRVLQGLGAQHVFAFVPNRLTDGYDLGPAGVAEARRVGASLVVTCDCGTSAHAPVAELMADGVDVIITDHHLPGGPLPAAYAICNPRRPECLSVDKDLAAVGVAYKIALALCDAFGVSRALAQRQLDLVALATIADVAPLRGENRVLVRYGLKLLSESAHPGLRALIRSSGLEGKPLTAGVWASCSRHVSTRRGALPTRVSGSPCCWPNVRTRPTSSRGNSRSSIARARSWTSACSTTRCDSWTSRRCGIAWASCCRAKDGTPA